MVKGQLNVVEDDLDSLYDLGDEVELYLAAHVRFDEWCVARSEGGGSVEG